jgi:hypothetical protein
MELQADWLLRGYFDVTDPSGGPSATQCIRDELAAGLDQPPETLHIKSYPVGPTWRHTYWWREGHLDYAETQFFAQISEEFPVLSVGISVEKGLENDEAAPPGFLMDRTTWDWQRLVDRASEVLGVAIPECATALRRPVALRLNATRYDPGKTTQSERTTFRKAFVFIAGSWFERHSGTASPPKIVEHRSDLDRRAEWWVGASVVCDLGPGEINGMSPGALASLLLKFAPMRQRLRAEAVL